MANFDFKNVSSPSSYYPSSQHPVEKISNPNQNITNILNLNNENEKRNSTTTSGSNNPYNSLKYIYNSYYPQATSNKKQNNAQTPINSQAKPANIDLSENEPKNNVNNPKITNPNSKIITNDNHNNNRHSAFIINPILKSSNNDSGGGDSAKNESKNSHLKSYNDHRYSSYEPFDYFSFLNQSIVQPPVSLQSVRNDVLQEATKNYNQPNNNNLNNQNNVNRRQIKIRNLDKVNNNNHHHKQDDDYFKNDDVDFKAFKERFNLNNNSTASNHLKSLSNRHSINIDDLTQSNNRQNKHNNNDPQLSDSYPTDSSVNREKRARSINNLNTADLQNSNNITSSTESPLFQKIMAKLAELPDSMLLKAAKSPGQHANIASPNSNINKDSLKNISTKSVDNSVLESENAKSKSLIKQPQNKSLSFLDEKANQNNNNNNGLPILPQIKESRENIITETVLPLSSKPPIVVVKEIVQKNKTKQSDFLNVKTAKEENSKVTILTYPKFINSHIPQLTNSNKINETRKNEPAANQEISNKSNFSNTEKIKTHLVNAKENNPLIIIGKNKPDGNKIRDYSPMTKTINNQNLVTNENPITIKTVKTENKNTSTISVAPSAAQTTSASNNLKNLSVKTTPGAKILITLPQTKVTVLEIPIQNSGLKVDSDKNSPQPKSLFKFNLYLIFLS
jgi:hypothetical protein